MNTLPKKTAAQVASGARCHAARSDGECHWKDCPQIRDGEPDKSDRHCPLDTWDDEDAGTEGGR